jgi:hypothetical protein
LFQDARFLLRFLQQPAPRLENYPVAFIQCLTLERTFCML